MSARNLSLAPWAAALAAPALLLSPAMTGTAHACGGFWCSQAAPVNQAAEQIIFVDNPDGSVTAVIQIQYVGPSEKFAWVIPIPGDPEIAVSSNTVFDRLSLATNPRYVLEQEVEGTCMQQPFTQAFPGASSAGAGAPAPERSDTDATPPIMVVNQGSVGPYNYATIAVDPSLAEPADAAIEWFMNEGYDLTGVDAELLGPYLADGLNLLAFRLTKGAGEQAGAIRPVILTYESELPMIPIRPTAVAAQNDMGIRIWVAAETQAVPKNYKSLVINEALINWFNFTQNYDDVVTEAANQAGGQGFVTELASDMEPYEETIFSQSDEQQWQSVMNQTFGDVIDAMWAANSYYRAWDGWRDAIEASVTLPEGVSLDDFARTPDAYRGMVQGDVDDFLGELYERVVKPVIDTQALVAARPYLTRLYSTMSAEEMTVDPSFTYNPELADVSNLHTAKLFIECDPTVTVFQAPWRIELPQGGVIRGQGRSGWPLAIDALPANLKVVQLSTNGSGVVVEDNSRAIGNELFDRSQTMPSGEAIPEPPATGMMIGGDQTVEIDPDLMRGGGRSSDGGLCAVAVPGRSAGRGALLFVTLGLCAGFVMRRRMR